jgi:hypothetical protein
VVYLKIRYKELFDKAYPIAVRRSELTLCLAIFRSTLSLFLAKAVPSLHRRHAIRLMRSPALSSIFRRFKQLCFTARACTTTT